MQHLAALHNFPWIFDMAYCTSPYHVGGRYFSQPTAGVERSYDGRGRPPSHCPDCDAYIVLKSRYPSVCTECVICGTPITRRNATTCGQTCRSRLHQVRRRVGSDD